MGKILFAIILAIATGFQAKSQNIINQSPPGFDSPRNEIKKGKIDTIVYYSKTVGTKRKALVYTPPAYTKTRKYPVLTDRESRAIAGSSMGLQTLYAGINNTDLFSYSGVFSSGWIPSDIHGPSGEITCLTLHNFCLNSQILNKLLK